ncbi:hypothetical protein C1645_826126 [Glomus cerebriforme]|uniref:Uncharacterized protein n=1 Tax=Glomus cerebriforme TaxID=658196 RepID=A0A397SVF1_9GLOM|nr:hypothetical protein C1645_826126 [Glomus cerebriforme]
MKVHQEIQKRGKRHKDEDEDEKEEEVLNSSHQFISIILQLRPHTPITLPTPTERQRSRRSTPIVELLIAEPAQSQHSTSMVRQILFDNRSPFNNIETQVKKLNSNKDNELNSKVFNINNNLVCIILSYLDI